jgi:SAM-dependent methyltransferase
VEGLVGLVRCAACELTFVNPRPSDALLSRFYSGTSYNCHAANDNRATRDKAAFVLGAIQSEAPFARRLLDFGAGGGWLIRRAKEAGLDAVGYDVGERSLEVCREQGLEVSSDLDALPRRSFDAVLLHHVLEHLPDPSSTLRGLAALLSPRGKLFIEVPNAYSLRARLSLPALSRHAGLDERYRAFPIHLSYFGPRALRTLLERAGYRLERLNSHGFGLDELFYAEETPNDAYRAAPVARGLRGARASAALRPFKTRIKRALYSRLLGESLFAVARVSPAS